MHFLVQGVIVALAAVFLAPFLAVVFLVEERLVGMAS
jgi:hypothetical protein